MKKILLVSPYAEGLEDRNAYPPLGLLYLASNMKGWDPELEVMTGKVFDKFDYEHYGISVHSVGVAKEVNRLIRLIERNNIHAKIYVGGSAHALVDGKNVVYVAGEGEKFFGDVDVQNLDNIAYPARHLLPEAMSHYKGNVHHAAEPSTTIIGTRGCVYNCSFCDRVTLGRKFRKRSAKNICGEIEQIIGDGIKWFRFVDDCITLDRGWFIDLCGHLEGYGVRWTCLSRADLLTDEMLNAMKKAGCQEIFFGFESGSQKMLDLMNKRTTVEKNIKAVEMCRNFGITSCAYMMFGFPGEDEESVRDTIRFLETARPDKSRVSVFVPVPGTDVWNNPEKYGVRIKENYEDFWYFDKTEFGVEYKYIGNEKMCRLKDEVMNFYEKNFKENWICSTFRKL